MGATARDLKEYKLEELITTKSEKTGANIQKWTDVGTILVAVYKGRTTVIVDKIRKIAITHKGLTKYKNLRGEFNRLVDKEGSFLYISQVYPGLWTNLDLTTEEIK